MRVRQFHWIDPLTNFFADVQYALRGLRHAPGYAATIVLTLGLGLGAVTAMLAVVDSVLLRPLDYPQAKQIDSLRFSSADGQVQDNASWQQYQALRDKVKSFAAVAAFSTLPGPVVTDEESTIQVVVHSTPSLFSVAGTLPLLGRWLVDRDLHHPVVVVGNTYWHSSLHSDAKVVGTTLHVDGHLATIVGVMPAGFTFPVGGGEAAVFAPLELDSTGKDAHGFSSFDIVARRSSNATRAAAQSEATAVLRHMPTAAGEKPLRLELRPFLVTVTGDQQPALLELLGACALLLAIACMNAANLQIARSSTRMSEMATRSALGASRGRLLQQMVTESLTVTTLGAALGLLLSTGMLAVARQNYASLFPRFDEVRLHPSTFAACALLAVVSGVLAALAPAARVFGSLRGSAGAQASTARFSRRNRLAVALVASEVALTCVLLAASGLFLRSFQALQQVPLGFHPAGATSLTLMPEDPGQTAQAQQVIYQGLVARLQQLPGVSAAAFNSSLPFSPFQMTFFSEFHVAGHASPSKPTTQLVIAGRDYVKAMQIPLVAGRWFSQIDSHSSPLVAVVNQQFLRRYLPGGAVGSQLDFGTDMKIKQPVTIIGVVGDTLQGRDLTGSRDALLYLLPEQLPADLEAAHFLLGIAPQFVLRSQLPPAALARAVKAAVHSEAPGFAVMRIEPIEDGIAGTLVARKLALRLASGFGLLALVLAATGIYGVLAYTVAERTREIGIRMALGSSRRAALGLVLRQAGLMCSTGLALGLLAVWPASRGMRAFLFGVPALDPVTLSAVTLLLALVCLLAAAVPACRAASVDPMVALRSE